MNRLIYGTLTLLVLALPARAQMPANNSQPIEITATETVEWLRNQKQYVARKDVIVTQGAMQIETDLLTADYREGPNSSMEIWQLTAEGNVRIKDENNTAYGDKAVYNVTDGVAVLNGQDLKLVSPDQTVTARERMEYHANQRKAMAIGNATVVRAKDTLSADTITAFFKDKAAEPATPAPQKTAAAGPLSGGSNIDRLEADGNVIIKTPAETLYGSKAIYRADTNTATLTGKVKVERGENMLEGAKADVNLTTNVSKMYGSPKEGGRVRGIFFPGSGDMKKMSGKPENSPNPPAKASEAKTEAFFPAGQTSAAPPATQTIAPTAPVAPAPLSPTPSAPQPAKVSPRIDY